MIKTFKAYLSVFFFFLLRYSQPANIRCSNSGSPPDGDSHGFGRTGTWANDLRSQPTCLEHVEESIAGRYRPCVGTGAHTRVHTDSIDYNTNTVNQDHLLKPQTVFYGRFGFTVPCQRVDSHGLAPSATMSMRREARLMSLWSFWASRDQCMSLDFTTATRAARFAGHEIRHMVGRMD